ncbi:hypothetical protein AcW2_006251 [Taiwanofungus camphoratus]|nr:hypothetical protein AcW2_006251 [Antrodia cinnamomea]
MAANAQTPSEGIPSEPSASRGRIIASRYLNSSASRSILASTGRSAKSAKSSVHGATNAASASHHRAANVKPSNNSRRQNAARAGSGPARNANVGSSAVVKDNPLTSVRTGSSLSRNGPSKDHPRPVSSRAQRLLSSIDTDDLQIAAQLQSWLFMSTALQDRARTAKLAAHSAIETREKQLLAEENDITDSRIRFEAERLLRFYEELANPAIASEVPIVVQGFLNFEDACSKAVSEAFHLTSRPLDNNIYIHQYSETLKTIDELCSQGEQLESSIHLLSSSATHSDDRVLVVLLSLLPVIRSYCTNLASAQSLVQCCKDSKRIGLQIESLKLA